MAAVGDGHSGRRWRALSHSGDGDQTRGSWLHASHRRRLLHEHVADEVIRAMGLRFASGSVLCAVITVLALVQVELSLAGYGLVLAYYGLTGIRRTGATGGV